MKAKYLVVIALFVALAAIAAFRLKSSPLAGPLPPTGASLTSPTVAGGGDGAGSGAQVVGRREPLDEGSGEIAERVQTGEALVADGGEGELGTPVADQWQEAYEDVEGGVLGVESADESEGTLGWIAVDRLVPDDVLVPNQPAYDSGPGRLGDF